MGAVVAVVVVLAFVCRLSSSFTATGPTEPPPAAVDISKVGFPAASCARQPPGTPWFSASHPTPAPAAAVADAPARIASMRSNGRSGLTAISATDEPLALHTPHQAPTPVASSSASQQWLRRLLHQLQKHQYSWFRTCRYNCLSRRNRRSRQQNRQRSSCCCCRHSICQLC